MHKLIPFHKTRRGHPRRGRTSPCASGPRMGWGDGRSAAPFMQGSSIDRNKFITEFPRHDFKRLGVPCGFEDCHERLCAEFCAFAIGVALPEQSRVGFSRRRTGSKDTFTVRKSCRASLPVPGLRWRASLTCRGIR